MEFLQFWAFVSWLANIVLCSWLAAQKGYNGGRWAILAVFFGPLVTLVLAGAPAQVKIKAD